MKPSAEYQIQFLSNLQRLLSEGQFVATYKYALLLAIADVAVELGDDSGDSMPIETRQLAEKLVEYYWRQAAPYQPGGIRGAVLRQNTGNPAEIVVHLHELREQQPSLSSVKRNPREWTHTVRKVDRVVKQMPLWKLQTVGRGTLEFLYQNRMSGTAIELKPGVAFCLRQFHGLIQELVQSAWVRYIRRNNTELLGTATDLMDFMFGSARGSLQAVALVLREVQGDQCFYCGRTLGPETGEAHVDHFIAWSRYPVDLGHNFVLADSRCNSAKADHIASSEHLEHWVERNIRFGSDLESGFNERNVPHDLSATMHVAQWAYEQTATNQGLTWSHHQELVPLRPDWTSILGKVRQ
jgi:hypothetical protein